MSDVVKLLDKARSLCSPPTWYQLAKRLDVKETTLSRCRLHGGTLANDAAFRLADLLGQDRADVVALMELARARDPVKRAFWEKQLPRIVPVVAYLVGTTGALVCASLTTERLTTTVSQLIHYAKSLYRRTVRVEVAGLTAFGLVRYAH